MSMNYIPGSGYLLYFSNKTFEILELQYTDEFKDFCEIHNIDPNTKPYADFMAWADGEEINSDRQFIGPFSVRIINVDGMEDYTELEEGSYFLFDEDEIITRHYTEFGRALEDNDLSPMFVQYTVFG